MMDEDKDHTRGQELVDRVEGILNQAFDEISFEMGVGGEKYELILTPEGDKVKLFELVYFQKPRPKRGAGALEYPGGPSAHPKHRPAYRGWMGHLRGGCADLAGGTGQKQLRPLCLLRKAAAYAPEAEGRVWWMLTTLTDQVLGEVPHMRSIDSFDVLEEPKAEPSIPMSQLPDKLKEKGANLSTDPETYLNSYLGYKMEPNKDPDADWRLDVMVGSTCCPASSTAI